MKQKNIFLLTGINKNKSRNHNNNNLFKLNKNSLKNSLTPNKVLKSLTKFDTSYKTKYSLYKNLSNTTNNSNNKKINYSNLNYKSKVNDIIKQFDKNKNLTKNLFKKEKNLSLNSLNTTFYKALIDNKYLNNSNDKIEQSKFAKNLIKKFNNKTIGLFKTKSIEKKTKFSNNVNEFRKQIINSFSDCNLNDNIKTSKTDYQNAMNFFIEKDRQKILEAEYEEKQFYKRKQQNEIFDNNLLNNEELKKNYVNYKNNLYYNNYNENNENVDDILNLNNINNKNNNISIITPEYFLQKQNEYKNYKKNEYSKHSKILAESILKMDALPYENLKQIKKKRIEINGYNQNNLNRKIKLYNIVHNLRDYDNDDLLEYDIKELKNFIKNAESEYYNRIKNNEHQPFLKRRLNDKTLGKFKTIKGMYFGIPV